MKRLVIAVFTALIGVASAAPPGITLYSSLAYAKPVAKAFTEKTGIPVHMVAARSADILAHIVGQGHHPRWSLAWFDGATSAVTLDHAGLLQHGLPVPADLTRFGAKMTSHSGAYVPTGLTLAAVLVAVANPYVTPPLRWSALTDAAYHGVIGMDDPQLARATYTALAGLLQANGGWPHGKIFIKNLKEDGLHIYADDADTLAALRSGSVSLAVSRSSIAFDDAATHDKSLRIAFPKPVYAMPSVIVMAAGIAAKQRAAALKFIAFVNRPATQALRMRAGGGDGWYWPVTKQPSPHAGLPPLASLDPRALDAQDWGRLQPRIIAWFNRRIVGPGN